jgi:hypothetical protein
MERVKMCTNWTLPSGSVCFESKLRSSYTETGRRILSVFVCVADTDTFEVPLPVTIDNKLIPGKSFSCTYTWSPEISSHCEAVAGGKAMAVCVPRVPEPT